MKIQVFNKRQKLLNNVIRLSVCIHLEIPNFQVSVIVELPKKSLRNIRVVANQIICRELS